MASIITHSLVGLGAALMMPKDWRTGTFMLMASIAPSLPDLDVLGFYAGIPYDSFFGHRGFFHSLFFAFLLGGMLSLIIKLLDSKLKNISMSKLIFFMGIVICSHGILDAMTTGGHGIALFSPINDERYFLPWHIIKVSPMHISDFISGWGIAVLKSEIKVVWFPLILLVISKRILFPEQ